MSERMTFPDNIDEFMEQYKITDTEQVYTNGCELVPIFRMKQWFESHPEPHWIPVTERLPEEERECWITPKTTNKVYRGVFTRHYGECHRTGFICDDGFMWLNTALAWMYCEAPEPYKGVTE